MLTVHEVMPLEDGLPVVPEENFLEPEGAEDEEQPGASLNFTSIRRKPKLRLGHLKERLKAFGAERVQSTSKSERRKSKKRKSFKQELL